MTVEVHTGKYHSISWHWPLWETDCTCHLSLETAPTSPAGTKTRGFLSEKKKTDLHYKANIFSFLGSGMNGCNSGDQKGKTVFPFWSAQKPLKSLASVGG